MCLPCHSVSFLVCPFLPPSHPSLTASLSAFPHGCPCVPENLSHSASFSLLLTWLSLPHCLLLFLCSPPLCPPDVVPSPSPCAVYSVYTMTGIVLCGNDTRWFLRFVLTLTSPWMIYKLLFRLHESSLCWFDACAPEQCSSVWSHILRPMNILPRGSQSFTAMQQVTQIEFVTKENKPKNIVELIMKGQQSCGRKMKTCRLEI